MLQRNLLFFFFLLSGAAVFAQGTGSVKGVVKDSTGKGVEAVSVVIDNHEKYYTTTDKNGAFNLVVPANQSLTLVFSSLNIFPAKRNVTVATGETKTIVQIISEKPNALPGATVTAHHDVKDLPSVSDIKVQTQLATANESFEAGLAFQALGVSKTNELSSNYSVRGGNFDENLVYVNDFEIYRPYLIRSAEQEGLSFVNPDMVQNVKFSSGGFQARYGDKMSSVMDVTYRRPDSISGSFYASLLGFGGHLEGTDRKKRFAFSVGVRQRLSQYVLQSLDTKGNYSPNFLDVQGFLTYRISEKVGLEALVNYSRNQYNFVPVDRTTTFGVLTDVKELQVYYNGAEADQYQTSTDGLSLVYDPTKDLHIKFLASYVLDREKQAFDITGQYYLSEVQSNLGSSNFGQPLYSLGSGGLQNWGRDNLSQDIYTIANRGAWFKKGHELQWGVDYKREQVTGQKSEWTLLDSAGYTSPYIFTSNFNNYTNGILNPFSRDSLNLNSVLKTNYVLNSDRFSAFIQDTWQFGDSNKFTFNYGLRWQYWDINKEMTIPTPRVQFTWRPKGKKDIVVTAATGLYYQPPSFREMLNGFTGQLNTHMLAQKSFHAVVGFDYAFKAWHRNFDFTTEAYYKYMWNLDPYQYNEDLIEYLGNNSAVGYAAGLDMRLHGELAAGLESWISMSIMETQQKINGASYEAYYDSSGTQIANSQDNRPFITDSTTKHPGYFPRPTDQRVSFNMYFQDYIPKFPFIKIHINLVFASALPFGPPGPNFWQDYLRMPPYRRVDIGFSGQLWTPKWAKRKTKFNQGLKSAWLSLEVFNIFGIQNVVSYLWISDTAGDQYAVPNYLTNRLVNLKFVANF